MWDSGMPERKRIAVACLRGKRRLAVGLVCAHCMHGLTVAACELCPGSCRLIEWTRYRTVDKKDTNETNVSPHAVPFGSATWSQRFVWNLSISIYFYIYIHIYARKPSVWPLHYTYNWTGDMFCVVETPFRCCWFSIDAGLHVIASLLLEICVQTNLW